MCCKFTLECWRIHYAQGHRRLKYHAVECSIFLIWNNVCRRQNNCPVVCSIYLAILHNENTDYSWWEISSLLNFYLSKEIPSIGKLVLIVTYIRKSTFLQMVRFKCNLIDFIKITCSLPANIGMTDVFVDNLYYYLGLTVTNGFRILPNCEKSSNSNNSKPSTDNMLQWCRHNKYCIQ